MSYVASELRALRKENARLNRRVAMMEMSGVVAERNAANGKVRIELGEDPDTGAKVLSDWVRVQSGSAGAFKAFSLPSIGEQMSLHSASGVVGADSVARYGTFTDANKPPTQEPDEAVLGEMGGTRLALKAGRLVLKVDGVTQEITSGGMKLTGGKITHDERNIGSSHKHGGVRSGSDKTSDPEA